MADCGNCLHEEVCATAKTCDGRVPRCKHFLQKGTLIPVTCKLGEKGCYGDGKCRYSKPCENKVITRADQLRAMTDEQLAAALYDNANCVWCGNLAECGEKMDANDPIEDAKCLACLLAWLQQPVEEGTP